MVDFILEEVCHGLAATTSDGSLVNNRFNVDEINTATAKPEELNI